MLGLCLVAVFALSAVATASASASGRPEFKMCVKKKDGNYNAGCASHSAMGKGKAELKEVAAGMKFTSKSKATKIKADGKVVTCSKDTDKGELLDQFTEMVTITFTGCKTGSTTCGSAGTIKTGLLSGNLYFINASESERGIAFSNEETGVFAEFKCGSETVVLEGDLIGATKNSSKGLTITFAVNGSGEQAHKAVWFSETEIGPIALVSGEEEATVVGTDEQGPKGLGAFS